MSSPLKLGDRLTVSGDGKTAEIIVLVQSVLRIFLGESFSGTLVDTRKEENFLEIAYSNDTALRIDRYLDDALQLEVYRFRWQMPPEDLHYLKDTFSLGNCQWYGGAIRPNQRWTIGGVNDTYQMQPHLVYDVLKTPISGQERYWLCSERVAVHVPDFVPLWTELDNSYLKLQAQMDNSPYANFEYYNPTFLEYEVALEKLSNGAIVEAFHLQTLQQFHQHCFKRYLKSPTGTPDKLVIAKPIWSTWAQFLKEIDQKNVTSFYRKILEHGFPISQLELDDKWTTEYGDFEVDSTKFHDFLAMVNELAEQGVRLTVWVHPFINIESRNFANDTLRKYYVQRVDGEQPLVKWWDGKGYAVDFTNDDAAAWYRSQLDDLRSRYRIHSFKFDAGELNFMPDRFRLTDGATRPNDYPRRYAEFAATFGGAVECRMGSGSQEVPIFVRTVDRMSEWDDVGLRTMIPSILVASLHGYFWTLPDMIGGNGYGDAIDQGFDHNGRNLPSKELFIRWVETNTFCLGVQFSFAPWDYDEETVNITKSMLQIREKWMPYILLECEKAVKTKEPVIRPLWWISDDKEALSCSDQYLVGDRLLVAPVLARSAESRQVYLPRGHWRDGNSGKEIIGPRTIEVSAPLDVLPYFIREDLSQSVAGVS